MAGCDAPKRAQCKAQGLICKKGRCQRSAADKKLKAKGGVRKATARPSTSMVAGAVLANVGSPTAVSLTTKRRSAKLGAGMETMVAMTRGHMSPKHMSPKHMSSKRRGRQTKTGPKGERTLRGGGGYGNRMVNWSKDGLPGRRMKPAQRTSSGECAKPCANPKRPVQDKKTCKCYAEGSAAARQAGICLPRTGTRNGKPYTYETVPMKNKRGGISCVKAGGSTAKEALGAKACPPGQVIKPYTTRVPVLDRETGTWTGQLRSVSATRCVKAVGDRKDCPTNQVLAVVPHAREGPQKRCVLAATAAKKGYQVLKTGSLPQRAYRVHRPAMSPGM